jgi:hypothetical protein
MWKMGKQAGTLRADHLETWKLGQELADEAVATRSPDLVRMIHERGEEGINEYVRQVSEGVVMAASSGEIDLPEPATEGALTALGISCGMALKDALDREAR